MRSLHPLWSTGLPPVWVRLAKVAREIGLTPEVIEAEAAAGRIPIEIQRFGSRGIRYTRAAHVQRYLDALNTTTKESTHGMQP